MYHFNYLEVLYVLNHCCGTRNISSNPQRIKCLWTPLSQQRPCIQQTSSNWLPDCTEDFIIPSTKYLLLYVFSFFTCWRSGCDLAASRVPIHVFYFVFSFSRKFSIKLYNSISWLRVHLAWFICDSHISCIRVRYIFVNALIWIYLGIQVHCRWGVSECFSP